jgi:cytochrome c nitrite reductase small subunit
MRAITFTRQKIVLIVLGILFGVLAGLGVYTFIYAKGLSYLTDDPLACANCHVMKDHFDSWTKHSHHAAAVCNDCHTPEGFIGKYYTKALNGYNHSLAFTTGNFPEPIQITARNIRIANNSCRKCHADIVAMIETRDETKMSLDCLKCHYSVGH